MKRYLPCHRLSEQVRLETEAALGSHLLLLFDPVALTWAGTYDDWLSMWLDAGERVRDGYLLVLGRCLVCERVHALDLVEDPQ